MLFVIQSDEITPIHPSGIGKWMDFGGK